MADALDHMYDHDERQIGSDDSSDESSDGASEGPATGSVPGNILPR